MLVLVQYITLGVCPQGVARFRTEEIRRARSAFIRRNAKSVTNACEEETDYVDNCSRYSQPTGFDASE